MMNKPGNPDAPLDVTDLMREAAHRIRFATEMLHQIEEPGDNPGYGGYEFAVVREILEDVAETLKAAAEHPEPV